MSLELSYDGLDEATVNVLKSEAVQKLLNDAHQAGITKAEEPLKRKNDELLGENREAKRKLKEVEDLGGIEALKALPEVKQEVTKKTDAEKSYADQVKELQKQLTDLKNQNLNEKLSAKLNKEIRELKGEPELLEVHVKSRIKHELGEDGVLKVTVLDKNGIPMIVDGKDATLKDLLNEFKSHATLSRAFDAPALNGAGTKTSITTSAGNPFATATKNISEQGRLVKTDRTRAIQLANEAGVRIQGLNV